MNRYYSISEFDISKYWKYNEVGSKANSIPNQQFREVILVVRLLSHDFH